MDKLSKKWLSKLCQQLSGAMRAAVFYNGHSDKTKNPIAVWPESGVNISDFTSNSEQLLSRKTSFVLQNWAWQGAAGEPRDLVVVPVKSSADQSGVVLIELSGRTPAALQTAAEVVQNAVEWFEIIKGFYVTQTQGEVTAALDFVFSALDFESFEEAATAVATELTTKLPCNRVAIGFLEKDRVKVQALSHNAGVDLQSNLVQDIADAMEEAVEQEMALEYPTGNDSFYIDRCHEKLASQHHFSSIVTIPFLSEQKIAGTILIEGLQDINSGKEHVDQLRQLVSLIGPILQLRKNSEKWFSQRLLTGIRRQVSRFLGAGFIGTKLTALGCITLIVILSLVETDYRVSTKARLEAKSQRVVVAPQKGYIAQAQVRPGDIVKEGDILGALDDKDLKLQRYKLSSQIEQMQKEYRSALANHNRAEVSIIQAKARQSKAQLDLVKEQLSRLRLSAPFNGVIVHGDLSQSLGAPVERGDVLFTVAPLDEYRVILQVDEREISAVKVGQQGSLMLSGMVGESLEFVVNKITPVSVPEKGRNYFVVEAKIVDNSDLLRPGMEGVGKIEIDSRKLIWIWSHSLLDWFKLRFWGLFP